MRTEQTRQTPGKRRLGVITVAALGLVATLAGCGSSQAGPTKPSPGSNALLTAYSDPLGAGTAKIAIDETVKAPGKIVTLSGGGDIDFTSQDGDVTLTVPDEGTIEVRSLPPEAYFQAPTLFGSELPAGKTWASLNIDAVTKSTLGADLSDLSDSSQQSTSSLSYLEAVSNTGVATVGPATIRGVPTTEYRASIDLTKVGGLKDAAGRAALQKLAAELHTTSLPITVWLDGEGRVAQESYAVSIPSSAGTTSSSVTIGYYDFGSPVSVNAPPASEVYDVTSQVIAAGDTTS